jgi:hypothetical protein
MMSNSLSIGRCCVFINTVASDANAEVQTLVTLQIQLCIATSAEP